MFHRDRAGAWKSLVGTGSHFPASFVSLEGGLQGERKQQESQSCPQTRKRKIGVLKNIVFEDVAKVDKTLYKREKPTLSYRKPKGSSRTQI